MSVRKPDAIIAEFAQSFMSNAKWVKLITCLVANADVIKHARLKLVWDAEVRTFLFTEHSAYDFDFYATSVEAMVSGKPLGFYHYKDFEWLEIPRRYQIRKDPNNHKAGFVECEHDLAHIETVLAQVGALQIEASADAIRIWAYK
jgi:hypothetical protein